MFPTLDPPAIATSAYLTGSIHGVAVFCQAVVVNHALEVARNVSKGALG